MSRPKIAVRLAWVMLAVSTIAWPITQLTVARHEPPFVLGLSWFAVWQGSLLVLLTTDVRQEQSEE